MYLDLAETQRAMNHTLPIVRLLVIEWDKQTATTMQLIGENAED